MTYNMKAKFYNMDMRKLKLKAITAACVLFCFLICSAVVVSAVNVTTVFCDGESQTVYSFTDDADTIISRTDFEVKENDRIVLNGFEDNERESVIAIAKEHTVLIYDGDKFIARMRFTGTVEEALKKAGVELRKGDEANFGPEEGITDDICIKVSRGFKVSVTADGKTEKMYFVGGTVEKLLEKAGIELGENDVTSPKKGTIISKPTEVTVYRVKYKYKTVKSVIEHETKVEYDDSKYEDEAVVKVKGKNGKKTEKVREVYIDGKYNKTQVLETTINKEPVTKIVVRGTIERPGGYIGGYVSAKNVISELKAPFTIDLDENNRPVKYKKLITGKATAYCTGTTTSTGARAMPGRVAVDPREIPYGTKMYIVSSDGRWHYGYCVASDTGGFIYNSSTVVDLYMRSYNDCVNFGRRSVDIYILE